MSLLFAVAAALFGATGVGGDKPGAGIKPATQRRVPQKFCRLAGEIGEDRLGHVFGQMRVVIDLPHGRRIHEIDVPGDQFRKRGFGLVVHITLEQFAVSHVHLTI